MKENNEFRQSVKDILKLLSSRTQQLEFKLKNPSVNVALELLCIWFNDLYNPGSHLFKRSFTVEEYELIQEFNQFYDLRKGKLPETLEELHQDNDWEIIMDEAKRLLDKIN